jgi:hypothetical protein
MAVPATASSPARASSPPERVAALATAATSSGPPASAVAASRFYLGDHYPLDVAGSLLCAAAAAFVVTGLAALPALQPRLRRLEPAPARRRHPAGM